MTGISTFTAIRGVMNKVLHYEITANLLLYFLYEVPRTIPLLLGGMEGCSEQRCSTATAARNCPHPSNLAHPSYNFRCYLSYCLRDYAVKLLSAVGAKAHEVTLFTCTLAANIHWPHPLTPLTILKPLH